MEAERSHGLLSVSRRPRRAGGQFQSEYRGPRTRRAKGGLSCPKVGRLRPRKRQVIRKAWEKQMPQPEGRQKKLLLGLFALFKTSTDWLWPTHIREKNLLSLIYQFLIYPETYSQTHQTNV